MCHKIRSWGLPTGNICRAASEWVKRSGKGGTASRNGVLGHEEGLFDKLRPRA